MRFVFFFIATMLFGTLAMAKEKPALDEAEWKRLTEDVNYVEEEIEESSFNMPKIGLDPTIVKYTFFAIIIGVLIYVLVKYIMALQSAGVADANDTRIIEVKDLKEAEENPMQADLQKLITKLIAANDFRGAVRAHFLLVLQRLHKANFIEWEKPKTNFDYVFEVRKHNFHQDFIRLTRTFEYVWYGEQPVDATHFAENKNQVEHLLAQLPHE